jgi:O-antigen/teichoic acid export membrane protein
MSETEKEQSLLKKSAKGMKWSMMASILNMSLQIGYTSVMAYLLDPVAFGIMAIASVVVDFGRHVTNMGVGQAIVQKQDLNANDMKAAFSFSLGLGLSIYLIIFLSSDYVAWVYEKPEISSIIQWLGLSLVFVSISIPSQNLLRRRMQFKTLSIIGVLNFFFAYISVGVVFAYMGYGVWSLVFANLASKASLAIIYYMMAKHTLSLTFKWEHYKNILAYGSMMTINTLAEFAYQNISSLFIGKFSSLAGLGLFSRAHMLVYLPTRTITTNLSSVAFPAFSKIQDNIIKLKEGYLMIISIIALVVLPLTSGMLAGAEEIVGVILGPQWSDAVPIFRILSITIGISLITTFSGIVCDSTANLTSKFRLNILFIIVLVSSLVIALPWGLIGFACALLFTEICRNISYGLLMNKILKVNMYEYSEIYIPSLSVAAIVCLSIFGVKFLSDTLNLPILVTLLLEMSTGGIALLLGIWFLPTSVLRSRLINLMNRLKLDKIKNPLIIKVYQIYAKK